MALIPSRPASPATPAVVTLRAEGDTLVASPWVQALFDSWQEQQPLRFFCITRYAKWPNFMFIGHVGETDGQRRCPPDMPVFVMMSQCPEAGWIPAAPVWFMVECGLRIFKVYDPKEVPSAPRIRIAEAARWS